MVSRLALLKSAQSLSALAELLDFKPKSVSYILYHTPYAARYTTFEIPKRNGGVRTIKAPVEPLKVLQRALSELLQDCMDEVRQEAKRKDRIAHGFKRKRSIISNADRHLGRRWIFNLDLEDFFPSINFGRVRGFFLKSRDFALNPEVATVIAQIACHDNSLPQGSPCSPAISNLVAHLLDMRIVRLASRSGCTYSRYADDLTFSTDKREFPPAIAASAGADGAHAHTWRPGTPLQKIIERAGFKLNDKKTSLMYRDSRQRVTGLVVNDQIGVRREYRNTVRAMVHRLVKTGAFDVLGVQQRDGHPILEMRPGTHDELHGRLGFIDSIDGHNRRCTVERPAKKPPAPTKPPNRPSKKPPQEPAHPMSSRDNLYRLFLMYSLFYAAEAPVLVCEGETDNAYLTQAFRRLATEFPDLAEVLPQDKIQLRVRLYKYHQSSTARLLGLRTGGVSNLALFISQYSEATKKFGGPGPTHPVIVVYDNDSGATDVRGAIQKINTVAPKDTDPFVHVTANMYAVHVPGSHAIEQCFDTATRETVIDGKTFNGAKNADNTKHFGKVVFAQKVVRANADTIDFTGFRPLLTSLVAAILHHRGSVKSQAVRSAPTP
jgi:RNA-directed DNA polymerase